MSFAPIRTPKSTDYAVRYGINGSIEQQLRKKEFLEKFPFLAGPDEKNGISGNPGKNPIGQVLSIMG